MSEQQEARGDPGVAGSAVDRRRFVAYFGALGLSGTLFPGTLWALAQQQPITKETIQQAEDIADVHFTDAQREQMLDGLTSNVKAIELLHQTPLANSVEPATAFDAVLPWMSVPQSRKPRFRPTRVSGLKRPANLEEVAFWPITRLSELVRTRQVKPSELVEMYLARLKKHGPTLHGRSQRPTRLQTLAHAIRSSV